LPKIKVLNILISNEKDKFNLLKVIGGRTRERERERVIAASNLYIKLSEQVND
jgi:hypothetical protein